MKTLTKLFGDGLIPISSPILIERYNACLKEIGVTPTPLTEFHIDGIGWSPQIAAEKKDNYYLSLGPSNPFGIILTPEQHEKPVYFPNSSFDKAMLRAFFNSAQSQIADITSQTGIWLDIDDGISDYEDLDDLLLVDMIAVKPNVIGNLMKIAKEEFELARLFMEGDNWAIPSLRADIRVRGKAYGDLRNRDLVIEEMKFTNLHRFHTRAFGGTFVFRSLKQRKHLIIMENKTEHEARKGDVSNVYHIEDEYLLSTLVEEELVTFDADWHRKHPEDMMQKCDILLADAAFTENPELDFIKLTSAQKKQLVIDLERKGTLHAAYREVEHFLKFIQSKKEPDYTITSNDPLTERMLLCPTTSLPDSEKTIVWQLLSNIAPIDFVRLYAYDKNAFFDAYQTWPVGKKRYAENVIQQKYLSQ
jgi:hypothetical protein